MNIAPFFFIKVVARKPIRSPTAVASSSSNDSTVQFHEQFLGFVKQKNEQPSQPAVVQPKSKQKTIDCSNVLEDYSDKDDDNNDRNNDKTHVC